MYYDLHCHSNFSDGLARIDEIEEKCLKDDFSVVLTDHNEIRGSIKLFERGKVPTLPAIEACCKEGLEFLIYFNDTSKIESFYKKAIEPYRLGRFMVQLKNGALSVLGAAKEFEGKIVIAHPFGIGKKAVSYYKHDKAVIKEIEKLIHGVEIYNGNVHKSSNQKAQEYAKSLGLPITVGSDGHDISSIGQVTKEINLTNLFDEILGDGITDTNNSISMIKTGLIIAKEHTEYYLYSGKNHKKRITTELKRLQ